MSTLLSPSILAADFNHLPQEIIKMEKAGAQYIHLDVMDGKFVPAKTFDHKLVKEISHIHKMVNDVHLMVEEPWNVIPSYAKAGANVITIHYEACLDDAEVSSCLALIRSYGIKAGLSIKPATPVTVYEDFAGEFDLALIMSVEPGKGGQKFMESSLEKISYLAKKKENEGFLIQVDGGIGEETGKLVVEAGADILVAGSYLYGHADYQERAKLLLSL